MQWEADFLAVGDGERSGDAIALRYAPDLSRAPENQTVVVIDGGTKEAGETLVDHVRTHYRTKHVDVVLSTHPDGDHASGLTAVFEQLSVGALLMHRPWEHAAEIKSLFKSGKLTTGTLEEKIREGPAVREGPRGPRDEEGCPHRRAFPGREERQRLAPRPRSDPRLLPVARPRLPPDARREDR